MSLPVTNRRPVLEPGDAGHRDARGLTQQGHVGAKGEVQGLVESSVQHRGNYEGKNMFELQKHIKPSLRKEAEVVLTVNRQPEGPVHLSSHVGYFAGVGASIRQLGTEEKERESLTQKYVNQVSSSHSFSSLCIFRPALS